MAQDNEKPSQQRLSDDGFEKLVQLEGFKSTPSQDCKDGSAGQSLGVGMNEQGQPKLFQEMVAQIEKKGRPLTEAEAREYTKRALAEYEQSVRNLPNWKKLSQSQFDALVLMAFNKGGNGRRRAVEKSMKEGDMQAVRNAILNDRKKGRGGEDLSSRRAAEAAFFDKEGLSEQTESPSVVVEPANSLPRPHWINLEPPLHPNSSLFKESTNESPKLPREKDTYPGRTASARVGGGDMFGTVAFGGTVGAAVGVGYTTAVSSSTVTAGGAVSSTGIKLGISISW